MKNRGLSPFYPHFTRPFYASPFSRFRPASASGRRLPTTLEVSVVETQLGNQQGVTFNLVHHAVLIGYAP
jgi:hypothetical protein